MNQKFVLWLTHGHPGLGEDCRYGVENDPRSRLKGQSKTDTWSASRVKRLLVRRSRVRSAGTRL